MRIPEVSCCCKIHRLGPERQHKRIRVTWGHRMKVWSTSRICLRTHTRTPFFMSIPERPCYCKIHRVGPERQHKRISVTWGHRMKVWSTSRIFLRTHTRTPFFMRIPERPCFCKIHRLGLERQHKQIRVTWGHRMKDWSTPRICHRTHRPTPFFMRIPEGSCCC